MTFKQLKQDIFDFADKYIRDAENFKEKKSQNPLCRLFRHFKVPYRNLEQARQLQLECEQTPNPFDFIHNIYSICQNIQCSRTFLPEITEIIVESELFPNAKKAFKEIEQRIQDYNANTDRTSSDDWTTEDYISVLECAARTNSIEMEMLQII